MTTYDILDVLQRRMETLRASTTHVCSTGAQPSGVGVLPAPPEDEFGTMPQWTRDEIAKAERLDYEAMK